MCWELELQRLSIVRKVRRVIRTELWGHMLTRQAEKSQLNLRETEEWPQRGRN